MSRIPAGLVDAGSASLATFAVGIYAARSLPVDILGVYALFFSVFVLATVVPTQLVFVPAEVITLSLEPRRRVGVFWHSVRIAWGASSIALAAVGLAVLLAPVGTTGRTVTAFVTTVCVAVLFSPVQDHARRLFHLARRSWLAAAVSVAQLTMVVTFIGIFSILHVPPYWTAFGSLAGANVVSLAFAVVLAHRTGPASSGVIAGARELASSGKWLLAAALIPAIAGFAVAALVTKLAGPSALGHAEAARVVGQPLLVLAVGMSASLGPRSMEAATTLDLVRARRISTLFGGILTGIGLLYLLVAGIPSDLNLIQRLLPKAYEVRGLVPMTILANVLAAWTFSFRSELVGSRKEVALARAELIASATRIGVAATASVSGPYTVPAGFGMLGITRLVAYRRLLRRHYAASLGRRNP